jgi:protein ImuB
MKQELYACIHVADFPAQTLLRLRLDLKRKPIAVLEGRSPHETVCSFNQHARLKGISLGMTRLEVEEIREITLLPRSEEAEAVANKVVLECATKFSPRIEEVSDATTSAFVLDITGTERLFGSPQNISQRLRHCLAKAGFRASIAISANFHTVRLKAAFERGICVIPRGEEGNALANLPITSLDIDPDALDTFGLWGIRTLGQLVELTETELVIRLGSRARAWRNLARGTAAHTFQPIEPSLPLEEFCEFEDPVEQMDSLLFVGSRMIDCLSARTGERALSLASIAVNMRLESGRSHQLAIRPAIPTTDRKFLLKLLQLEIATHQPSAAVVALTFRAESGQSSKIQLGLFVPQMPEPSLLDVTLARLKALVGEDRVGSPVLDDTHCPGSFHMDEFSLAGKVSVTQRARARMALRRMRPPVAVRVVFLGTKPVALLDANSRYEITDAYGPWKTTGCWWSTDSWSIEEWDVLASSSNGGAMTCLLVHDLNRNQWLLEATYD